MRKIVIALITLLPIIAYADNMCVKAGSVLVVLDPQISGTALASDSTSKTWSTQFGYGVVSGIGACYSSEVGTNVMGDVASNQINLSPYDTGTLCYCKMLRPIESAWVFNYGSDPRFQSIFTSCASGCASKCSSNTASSVALRTGMFSNIAE